MNELALRRPAADVRRDEALAREFEARLQLVVTKRLGDRKVSNLTYSFPCNTSGAKLSLGTRSRARSCRSTSRSRS